jgi:mRNA interferase MazF
MVMSKYTPERGDIIWVNFSPHSGHEQGGRRPAIVISPYKYNFHAKLALVCPITSQVKGYPFEVKIPEGFKVGGVILSDHLKSIDWASRNGELIFKIPESIIAEVEKKILAILGR